MKNKQTTTYKWAYLPFVFSSATILATQVMASPGASQQYQDAKQVGTANYEYVGGKTQIGFGVTDDGDVSVDLNQVISESENSSTSAGLWAGYELKGDNKGVKGRGVQVNHNWVSRDDSGRATHVNKVFGAYDRNEAGHAKATVGYGQEKENLFWEGHVSKGLSDRKKVSYYDGKTISDVAYDYGVGGSVGKYIKGSNMRVRAGLDHEWGDDVGYGESTAKNTTLSAGIEKFFQGTPHSLGLDIAASKRSGGYEKGTDDTNVTGKLSYRYDFGGASIYQPDRRYRRVRVEVPGTAVAPRYSKKAQFKRVPTYKTVTTYGKKTVRTPYKQLVKSTMELEGQTFFKLNSARLIPSAKTRLLQVATQIRKNGYKGSIRITGNTCGLGDAAYDQRLSEQRAYAVKNFFIENGFNPDHLTARGLGKGHPKYPNTPSQGFKNRRVDVEYVTERQVSKTAYRTAEKRVKTGTRQVATGFKNVAVGSSNVLIDSGRPGTPRVIWKTEVIPSSPAWIKRALHNNIKHNTTVNTYQTTAGSNVGGGSVSADNDTATTYEGQAVTIDVLSNDDADATITRIVTQPTGGTATIVNGQILYTPNTGFVGTDTFTYEVRDPQGNTSTATVTVTVDAQTGSVNAGNDTAETKQGQAIYIDVLSNDDTDATITRIVTQPTSGTASIVNSQILYTPKAGFVGTDRFTYEVRDPQGNTTTATVTVVVGASTGNSAPVAVDDSIDTGTNQVISISVLDNDTDADNDTLTISSFTNGTNGTVTRGTNGQLIYTPRNGFTGTDTFTYTVSDGKGGTDTATVTVNVTGSTSNTAPKAADDSRDTDKNQAVTISVLGNDTDPDNDTLTVSSFTNGSNGTVTRGSNGQLIYTPKSGFTGTDSFTYTISDGKGGTDTATVTINVAGSTTNLKPDAVRDTKSTLLNQAVTIDVLANDIDPDNDTLTVSSFTNGSNGTVTRGANGQLIYTPKNGFTGTDTFEYSITDGKGGSDTTTVTVTVTGGSTGNSAPDAVDDSRDTDLNQAVTISVLGNDTDPENDTLTVSSFTNGSNGTVARGSNGQLIYTPKNGFTGTDTFTYTISDGKGGADTATVTINVAGSTSNSRPDAARDTSNTPVNQAVTIDVLANDTDPENDTLTVSSFTNGSNGTVTRSTNGQLVYTPRNGFTGSDTFSYSITDGKGGSDTTTVTVTVTGSTGNASPNAADDTRNTAINQAVSISVLGNDTDPDNDALTISSFTNGSNGTVTRGSNGRLVYTPRNGFTGTDTFTYVISDGNGGTDTATVTVNVAGSTSNSNPDAVKDTSSTQVNQAVTINVLANDTDPEKDTLTISSFTNGTNGTVTRGANGQLVYTPKSGFTGRDTFEYSITDGKGGNDTTTVTVSVNNSTSNSAPNAIDDTKDTTINQAVSISVLGNDTDPENDTLTVTTFTSGTNGTVTRGTNGELVYTPKSGFTGTDTFTYTISDGKGGTDTAKVTVNVTGSTSNSRPDAVRDTKSTSVNQAVSIDVLANDTDPENDTLTVSSFTNGSNGTVTRGTNGQLVYTPKNGFTGKDTFSYSITDGKGGSDTSTVTVDVTGSTSNSAPDAVRDAKSTSVNQAVTIDVLGNDTDPDNDSLTVSKFTNGTNGTVTRGSNGQLVYTPKNGFTGTDTFSYTISDGKGGSDRTTVTVTVTGNTSFSASNDSATTDFNTPVTVDVMDNDENAVRITQILNAPDNGTATIENGKIIYTPNAGFSGTDYLNYEVEDANGNKASATVAITVRPDTGGTPVAVNDTASTDCSAVTINVLDNDTGGNNLSIIGVSTASLGTAVISGNTIVYTPSSSCSTGNTGADDFTYTISDGHGNTATATVNVDVKGEDCNVCILAVTDETFTDEGKPVTISVLDNDSGKGLVITSVDNPANGTATIVGNSIQYTPNTGFVGTEVFYYDISDSKGKKDSATILVYVGGD